jgi:hypothetical protein
MRVSRRDALLSTLFGASCVGLRALATGLPASFLLNPRKALAQTADAGPSCTQSKAQYIIFCTSGNGDPLNASVPGTYEDPAIVHSPDPSMAPATLSLGGQNTTAAMPWTTLPASVLARTVFWHVMTNTPVHPKEPQVLELMGATPAGEMLPSMLAKVLAPCLQTIQTQPISIGASSPSEALSFSGTTLPIVPPLALKATLASPTGPLSTLQPLRDQTMNQLYALYKNGATPAQQQYIDSMVSSQQQVRNINQSLLATLDSIDDNLADSQMIAAIALIQMKVSPVIAVHVPFGGDNHRDIALATETAQTVSGVQTLVNLMQALQTAGLQDQVTFMTLNVFGRTLGPGNTDGRQHNLNHQVSLSIGKPFKGGVIGAIAPIVQNDYGALAIDSSSGAGTKTGDVMAVDTLAAFGQTMLAAVGADAGTIASITSPGSTSKVIGAALA